MKSSAPRRRTKRISTFGAQHQQVMSIRFPTIIVAFLLICITSSDSRTRHLSTTTITTTLVTSSSWSSSSSPSANFVAVEAFRAGQYGQSRWSSPLPWMSWVPYDHHRSVTTTPRHAVICAMMTTGKSRHGTRSTTSRCLSLRKTLLRHHRQPLNPSPSVSSHSLSMLLFLSSPAQGEGAGQQPKRPLTEQEKQVWQQRLNEMKQYQDENNGSSYPPLGEPLRNWADYQRSNFNRDQMYSDRIELLNSIDFQWSKPKGGPRLDWDRMFGRLVEYKERCGDTNVPSNYPEDPQLGKWCENQNALYSKGKLDSDRKAKLDGIGFVFHKVVPFDERWNEMYDRLFGYWKKNNSTIVRSSHEEDPELVNWVTNQRKLYNRNGSRMTPERAERLEAIGFVWNAQEADWLDMYNRLVEYWEEKGHSNFSTKSKEDPKLGKWVDGQRQVYKKGMFSPHRIARLEGIGFVWNAPEALWLEMYNRLNEYRQEEGDADVPQKYKKDPKLGTWVSNQRQAYKKDKLLPDKIKKLEAIGFKWSLNASPVETG